MNAEVILVPEGEVDVLNLGGGGPGG
jgi:hypothetical protein